MSVTLITKKEIIINNVLLVTYLLICLPFIVWSYINFFILVNECLSFTEFIKRLGDMDIMLPEVIAVVFGLLFINRSENMYKSK